MIRFPEGAEGVDRVRRLLPGALGVASIRRAAIIAAEQTADMEAIRDNESADGTLTSLLRGAAFRFTVELDAGGPPSVPDPSEDVEANVDRIRLRRAVAALPEVERHVVERHDYEGATFDEIAAAAGVHPTTVYYHYARAQEALRRAFEDRT